jgi:hypothetical protein
MKFVRTLLFSLALPTLFMAAQFPAMALENLLITEFMAENDNTLEDEDGDNSDWIEIYNAGTDTVNLLNWCLTDTPNNPNNWWRFPATNMAPNTFLIVFASGKDRSIAGAQLHTDFRLNDGGDYLALVKPDRVTKVSEFAPVYPPQVPGVSYGIPVEQTISTAVSTGATAKVFVPLGSGLGASWLVTEFDDSTWTNAVTGVGFETDGPTNVVVASTVDDFSGIQGQKNWFYGYYNRTLDPGAVYQASNFVAFPSGSGATSPDNFWTGVQWDWFAGNPPWDEIGQSNMHPNGINSGAEHWVIRRWISKVSGTVTIDWSLAKANLNGNGVTGLIYHKDTQRDTAIIAGNNGTGTNRTVVITGVQVGDTIDIILSPIGVAGATDDGSDGSIMTATIKGAVSLNSLVSTSIAGMMKDINSTAYLRIPFTVSNAVALDFLTLRMKYDDGFAAYLNGVHLASRNAPDILDWSSGASSERSDADANLFEEINVTPGLVAMREGINVLAIHGLNASLTNSDFLILPELRAGVSTLDTSAKRYFAAPTPGSINGLGTTNLGPLIFRVRHTPAEPRDEEDLVVTAEPRTTFNALSSMTLVYRVMFGAEIAVPMNDNGTNNDLLAGDGIYSGTIPGSASGIGQMVRYSVRANDVFNNFTRQPTFSNSVNAPAYFGTVVQNPTLTNALPVLHFFVPDATLSTANGDSAGRYQASLYYLGEFYDNIGFNRHGQSSAGADFLRKSYDLDFNPGNNFKYAEGEDRVDDANLLTTYPDKAKMRNMLSYGIYKDADSPYHWVHPIRVQHNGVYYADYHLVENGDENFLKRIGRDPKGSFYKMYNMFSDPASDVLISPNVEAEKKTRKDESNADLVALMAGVSLAGTARANFAYDNINVPEAINMTAARDMTADIDCCHKNYYFYRDTEGSGEWEAMPWDVDLSFGRNWTECSNYWGDTMFPGNGIFRGGGNRFFDALYGTAAIRQMYLRRIRTLMDELLQAPGTPVNLLKFEAQMDYWQGLIGPDAELEKTRWATWGNCASPSTARTQSVAQAVMLMKTNYMHQRRTNMFNRTGSFSEIPAAQPANAVILINAVDYSPGSANQAQEYIELRNPNSYAVDISGWTLSGAVDFTFVGGSVIVANSMAYVVPEKKAFRARTEGPRGGQGLLVLGPYKGQLSARGETIILADKQTNIVHTNLYAGSPSGPQQYLKITEIMYHPPRAGSGIDAELFEYIELKNTGPTNLNLTGVHFTNGASPSTSRAARSPISPLAHASWWFATSPRLPRVTAADSMSPENISAFSTTPVRTCNSTTPSVKRFSISITTIIGIRSPMGRAPRWSSWTRMRTGAPGT